MKHISTPILAAHFAGNGPQIIGHRANGRPIFGIAGGSEDEPPTSGPINPDGKTFTQAEVDAIVLKRAERVAADKYGDYADLKAAKTRLDEIEAANATELEKAIKKAREEGASEVRSGANDRLVRAEARAIAAEAKFRNPGLAIKAIDLSEVEVSDDGTPDAAAIKTLLADLAKEEPYLIDEGKVRPKPDDAQGRPQNTPSKAEEGRSEARKRFGNPAGQ